MSEHISVSRLTAAVGGLFERVGLAPDAASIVASDLIAADLEGVHSHGVSLVPLYIKRLKAGSVSSALEGKVVSCNAGAIVIDGVDALGQLTGRQAVSEAVKAAKNYGIGAVALRNAFHIGALSLYSRLMADQECIGIVTTNTRPLLPAPGGAEAQTGNNPLAVTVPSSGHYHAEVDMALSAVAMGKIRNASVAKQAIPDTWATDADGKPTTDPEKAIEGMLLPAAGPKGFGLAFLLDLIAGGLSGGGIGPEVNGLYGDLAVPYSCSAFFLAIHVGHFADESSFQRRVADALARVEGSRKAPGVESIYAPGQLAWEARLASGATCAVSPASLAALADVAQELGIDFKSLINGDYDEN